MCIGLQGNLSMSVGESTEILGAVEMLCCDLFELGVIQARWQSGRRSRRVRRQNVKTALGLPSIPSPSIVFRRGRTTLRLGRGRHLYPPHILSSTRALAK